MEVNIADVNSRTNRHTEGLDGAIKVHVKDRVFIVPHAATQVGDFVTNEKDTIVARIRLRLVYRCACSCPCLDGRLHPDGVTLRRKRERVRTTANRKRTIGVIVEHVALVRMRLAPGKFMGGDVSGFAKVVHTRNQVIRIYQDPVRDTVVRVAVVVVCISREYSSERIDPGARADAVLVPIES